MKLTTPSATAKAPDTAFTGDVYVNPIKQKAEPSRCCALKPAAPPTTRISPNSSANSQPAVKPFARGGAPMTCAPTAAGSRRSTTP